MKPRIKLAETMTPNGMRFALTEHDGDYAIRLNGQDLMTSKAAASEILLGELAAERLANCTSPIILTAGLGLAITLNAMLAKLNGSAVVRVAELMPEVVDWNRTHLREFNGGVLDDKRVELIVGDVGKLIAHPPKSLYDAIVLDIDNGPTAMVQQENAHLYSSAGLRRIHAALKPNGFVAVWSAGEDKPFFKRLRQEGFEAQAIPAKRYEQSRRSDYLIFVGRKLPVASPKNSTDRRGIRN